MKMRAFILALFATGAIGVFFMGDALWLQDSPLPLSSTVLRTALNASLDKEKEEENYWRTAKEITMVHSTGRIGNALIEYAIYRALSFQFGKPFRCHYGGTFVAPFHNLTRFTNETPRVDMGLGYITRPLPMYYYEFSLFLGQRRLIQQYVFPGVRVTDQQFDLVIHVRLEDCCAHHYFVYLLPDFYTRILDDLMGQGKVNSTSRVAIVGRPTHDLQHLIISKLEELVRGKTASKDVKVFTDHTITEDYLCIMSSPILIGSTGTFWIMPAFVSRVVKEVHAPFQHATLLNYTFPPEDDFNVTLYTGLPKLPDEDVRRIWNEFTL